MMKVKVGKSKRDPRRLGYALRRMSLACDRVIRKENPEAAARWAKAWARIVL